MTSASENADRLSNLPEVLRPRILSVMPTKFAVQTCILSKSWRYSWKLVQGLDFDINHHSLKNKNNKNGTDDFRYRSECFSTFVDRVFELSKKSQLKKFRLHIDGIYVSESAELEWINKAIMFNVCELDIGVKYNTNFPSSMFTCKTLTKFTLHLNPYWNCPSSINLPFLKTLNIFCRLKDILYLARRPYPYFLRRLQSYVANALKVIHACPVLEDLSVETWFNNEDYTFKIPTLRKLKLTIWQSIPPFNKVNKVFLNVPNLEHLFLGGDLCSNFYMEDLLSMAEARVSCKVNDCHLLAELLKRLSGAKYISSTTYPNGKNANFKYLNLKRLELNGYAGLRWQLVTQILENCPELEYLSFEKPTGDCWNEPESVPTCMRLSLKTMKYAQTTCYWDDMKFLKFMLGNSNVLKTLTLRYAPTLSVTEKTRLHKNLATYAKASKDCEICFVES